MNRIGKRYIILGIFTVIYLSMYAGGNNSKYDSYKGLVMAGYQGWFNAPEDGMERGWYHYSGREGFKPGSTSVDFWPDVSEYEKTYATNFRFADGTTSHVFSSADESTVDTHFRWMKEYGLDGVFMQRFVGEIKNPGGKLHFNKVLASAMKAANKYERAICVMYDLSGMHPGDERGILNDIDELSTLHFMKERDKNPSYLYHNGKPLVTIWGVGFNDNRRYGLKEVEAIISGLKERGFSVMLGVPTHWRILSGDTESDPYLHTLIRECDIVMPWFVGRYNESRYPVYQTSVVEDVKWCKQNQVDYVPLVFPGFSWENLKGESAKVDFISRNKGSFLWKQIAGALEAGAQMLYVAMFDEIDEGTAIFKCATEVPVGKSKFVPIEEGLKSDHYLWLVGEAGKILRGEKKLSSDMPERNK